MSLSDPQDQKFISDLFPRRYQSLIPAFIDERPPETKRTEFNKMRKHLFTFLSRTEGLTCQLKFDCCDPTRGFDVDHLIPLSSNVLNKSLRNMKAEPRRKVATQSFGSNNPLNLILACKACNGHKKHNFVSAAEMERILDGKFYDRK